MITDGFEDLKDWQERVEREGPSAELCHEGREIVTRVSSDMSALLIIAMEHLDEEVWEGLQSDDQTTYFAALEQAMGAEGEADGA